MSGHNAVVGVLVASAALGLASLVTGMRRDKARPVTDLDRLRERMESDNLHTQLQAARIRQGVSREEILAMERAYWSRDDHTPGPPQ